MRSGSLFLFSPRLVFLHLVLEQYTCLRGEENPYTKNSAPIVRLPSSSGGEPCRERDDVVCRQGSASVSMVESRSVAGQSCREWWRLEKSIQKSCSQVCFARMLVSCAAWVLQLSDWRSSYAVGSSRTTRGSAAHRSHNCIMVMVGMGLLGCGSGTYGYNWYVIRLAFGVRVAEVS